MMLLHLLQQSKNKLIVAHVNFRLRGEESDKDEAFVRKYCEENELSVLIKRTEESDWNQYDGSIQMKARSIRYDWFDAYSILYLYDTVMIKKYLSKNNK